MNWHYSEGGQTRGPVTEAELRVKFQAGEITGETLIWSEGQPTPQAYHTVFLPIAAESSTATPPPPPPPPPAPEAAPPPTERTESFVFTAKASEYFRIWIVNVALTLVTLGIYAAWAKVRSRRYLYNHTTLFGQAFDYIADPKKILVGNIIAAALFAAYLISAQISPILYLMVVAVMIPAIPWFIVRALSFNARNTVWQGLSFSFRGKYKEALIAFVGYPLLTPFTLGFIIPVAQQRQMAFAMGNLDFGSTRFQFTASSERFFQLFFRLLGFGVLAIGAMFLVILFSAAFPGQKPVGLQAVFVILLQFVPLSIFATVALYARARLFNLRWSHTTVGPYRFVPSMRARDFIWLQVSNFLAIIGSVGLLAPWAIVRSTRFQLDSLKVVGPAESVEFVRSAGANLGAVGDSAADLLDFDIGIGA